MQYEILRQYIKNVATRAGKLPKSEFTHLWSRKFTSAILSETSDVKPTTFVNCMQNLMKKGN